MAVYERSASAWNSGTAIMQPNGASSFGSSVSLSHDAVFWSSDPIAGFGILAQACGECGCTRKSDAWVQLSLGDSPSEKRVPATREPKELACSARTSVTTTRSSVNSYERHRPITVASHAATTGKFRLSQAIVIVLSVVQMQ